MRSFDWFCHNISYIKVINNSCRIMAPMTIYSDFMIYLLYKTLRSNQPYAVRHASECPSPKFSENFWTPASKPLWPTRDPKFTGNFGAWAVPFERLGLFDGRKPDSLP